MKEKRRPKGKLLIGILCIVLAVLILLSTLAMAFFDKYYNKMNISDLDTKSLSEYLKGSKTETINEDDNEVKNILLIGSDDRTGLAGSRSDSIIIASVNPVKKTIVLTSILRDCYVDIPNHGKNRINAAYQYGGVELLLATIQTNFGIKLSSYARVDFESFKECIDALGGVEVTLTQDEANYIMGIKRDVKYPQERNSQWGLKEGTNTLTGEQALIHARNRSMGTDFERTRRQRDIISALIKKAKGSSSEDLTKLINVILPYITTNLTRTEVLSLASQGTKYSEYTIEQYSLPMDGTYSNLTTNGMAVLDIDCAANATAWYDIVY